MNVAKRSCNRLLMLMASVAGLGAASASPTLMEGTVKPSTADPGVKHFDDVSVVITPHVVPSDTPLVIFLPGTHGKPQYSVDLLRVIAAQGYRVIGLSYDDDPAAVQICPRDPDPDCFAHFREMRISGTGPGAPAIQNPRAESIEARLVAALRFLAGKDPGAGWGRFLDGDQPRWDEIVVSGLSQGAGMAAYIAKQHAVHRVVLFSSPWDFTVPGPHLARWIGRDSATPPSRWFAEYHAREVTAEALARSYVMLKILPDHVLVFNRDLQARAAAANNPNPYHGSTIRDLGYAEQWRVLYGKPSDPLG